MESTSKKQNTPKLWYWGEPKGGMSLEDCEKIVKEIPHFDRKTRLDSKGFIVAFNIRKRACFYTSLSFFYNLAPNY